MSELYNKKRKVATFKDKWQATLGSPELKGTWLIWGNSGNGKTSFALQLAKYLTKFGKVLYNSLEEGDSQSFELACRREGMINYKRKFYMASYNALELSEYLNSKRSAKIVIIDSFQYLGISYNDYKEFKTKYHDVLFIFISHADGKLPSGRPANAVRYDADIKINVSGYVATAVSRYGGGEPYIIWEEQAKLLNDKL